MKKITINLRAVLALTIFAFTSFVSAQNSLLLGFETNETGGPTADNFGGFAAPIIETGTGSNTTKVLKLVGNPNGEVWQGTNMTLSSPVSLTSTKSMTIDVMSATPIVFLVKVKDGVAGALEAAAPVVHNGNGQWQTLTFTFNTALDGKAITANGVYRTFVLHAYWAVGATDFGPVTRDNRTFYIDNLKGMLGVPPVEAAPTMAAPQPPMRPAADVVSIYSDAYAPITINNFDAGWCNGAATTPVKIEGNNTLKKKAGSDCQGIDFKENRLNLNDFTHLHFDFYITDTDLEGDVFNVKLVNFDNTDGEKSALEVNINGGSNPKLVANQWVSVDVDITKLEGVVAGSLKRNDIAQIGITTARVNNVWYDNIYLHKNTLGNSKFDNAKVSMYPNPVKSKLNINANGVIQKVSVRNILGQEVLKVNPKSTSVAVDTDNLRKGVYMVTSEVDGKTSTKKIVKE